VFSRTEFDATVIFQSQSAFWSIINIGGNFADGKATGKIKESGSEAALDLFRRKLLRSCETLPRATVVATAPSSSSILPSLPSITSNVKSELVSMKTGYLLKKRDLLSGWRCRYFVVFPGRVDYYVSKDDPQPRGSVDLTGAKISLSGFATINGADHLTLL
jgi:hypothetical protein